MQAGPQVGPHAMGPNLSASLMSQLVSQDQHGTHLQLTSPAIGGRHAPAIQLALSSTLLLGSREPTYLLNGTGTFDLQLVPLSRMTANYIMGPMQRLDSNLDYYFHDMWVQEGDERTSKFPLMGGGPWKLIYATFIYLALIKWLLPAAMRRAPALELTWPIRAYNLMMVASNLYALRHGIRLLDWGSKCFGCEIIDHQDYAPQTIELLHYGWLFLLSRLVEWLDTIFFVLRKRERQITKLHVFHHSFVPLISWIYLKFHPGYTVAFFPLVNSLVHSVMYTYYLLATFGPAVQRHLWWKRYLTSMQIAQFVLILVQLASIPLSASNKCHYPRGFLYAAFAGAILFLWLFFTYYLDTYGKKHSPTRMRKIGREGSSRSLSDSIDNAIDSGIEVTQTRRKTHKIN